MAIRAAAEAEARYKFVSAQTLLSVITEYEGRRTTVQEREARVEVAIANEHSAYLITQATAKSVRESIGAIKTQIEGLRTLAASARLLTTN